MTINLIVWGLYFDFLGVSILVFVNLLATWHNEQPQEKWNKRYYWEGWRPFLKRILPSGKVKREIRLKRKVLVFGALPPKHKGNLIGLLFIILGFSLQILGNLK